MLRLLNTHSQGLLLPLSMALFIVACVAQIPRSQNTAKNAEAERNSSTSTMAAARVESLVQDDTEGADSTALKGQAEIAIVPPVLQLTKDSTLWLSYKVKVLNRGSAPLSLKSVKGSCGCASATVLKNPIHPMDVGEILLKINTTTLRDSLNLIEYSIESDARVSPLIYRVYVRHPGFSAAQHPKN